MNLSVKDFLMFSWVFPYEHLYTDHNCTVTRAKGKNGDVYTLVYRNPQAPSGFTMVPFYHADPDAMEELVNSTSGKLSRACIEFLYGMLG